MPERRDLSPADACWLYSEWEKNHQTVSAFLWTDRRVNPDALREVVQTRLLDRYPVFVQRVVMSRNPVLMPHWEDDPDFDIDRHLEVVDLPPPADKATLEALIGEQRTPLLDRDHPLWKVYLIQGYDGGSAMHLRIQHSIADGWALVRLFLSLTDEADDDEADGDEATESPTLTRSATGSRTSPPGGRARCGSVVASRSSDRSTRSRPRPCPSCRSG